MPRFVEKLKLPWKSNNGIRRTKTLATEALAILEKATSLAAEISVDVGVPGLARGLAMLGAILKTIQVSVW